MPGAENCVSKGRLAAALCAALLLAGCVAGEGAVGEPLDTSYLAPTQARENVVFHISFARYNTLENDLIAEAWAAAKSPPAETDDLWRENGLRAAAADANAAETVRARVKRAGSLRIVGEQIVMWGQRPFDVAIGRVVPSTGLVYRTRKAKAFRDVVDLRFSLVVIVLGKGKDSRITVNAGFTEGADQRRDTRREVVDATFEFSEGMMILVGPREDPPDMSLAEAFYTQEETGEEAALVIIEPKLAY